MNKLLQISIPVIVCVAIAMIIYLVAAFILWYWNERLLFGAIRLGIAIGLIFGTISVLSTYHD